jgi:hypothetical protein
MKNRFLLTTVAVLARTLSQTAFSMLTQKEIDAKREEINDSFVLIIVYNAHNVEGIKVLQQKYPHQLTTLIHGVPELMASDWDKLIDDAVKSKTSFDFSEMGTFNEMALKSLKDQEDFLKRSSEGSKKTSTLSNKEEN